MAAEKNFENQVKKFLEDEGCYFIKYWGGGRFTRAGVPDLLVCCNGFFLGIELKAPNGKATEIQLNTLKQITKANGLAMVLYPKHFTDFKDFIRELKAGWDPEELIDRHKFISEWWWRV